MLFYDYLGKYVNLQPNDKISDFIKQIRSDEDFPKKATRFDTVFKYIAGNTTIFVDDPIIMFRVLTLLWKEYEYYVFFTTEPYKSTLEDKNINIEDINPSERIRWTEIRDFYLHTCSFSFEHSCFEALEDILLYRELENIKTKERAQEIMTAGKKNRRIRRNLSKEKNK